MDYLEKLLKKELKPHELDAYLPPEEAVATRRKYVEQIAGTKLLHVANSSIDFADASKRNIENAIGSVQLPVGFVELSVHGDYLDNDRALLFLATTEGKLVAGVNRGASAINKSGGARTKIIGKGMSRSVILDTGSAANSAKAMAYIRSKEGSELLRNAFKESNKRIDLLDAELYTTGRLLFVRYVADTKAAMGMNMLTIASTYATEKLVENLAKQGINAKFLSESGNMCVDKKPSAINMIRGRGVSVVAEAVVKADVLKAYFKVGSKEIEQLNYAKNYIGSSLAGSIAHNAHAANVLAASFIAYGQDVAQIVDAVNSVDDVKALENGDLYIAVYLPALEIGTYGGGTHRETAKELLMASGVYGEGDETGNSKYALAELIASGVLAGELNLLAAEAGRELAEAHSKLKR